MAAFSSQKFSPSSLAARGELLAQEHYIRFGCSIIANNVFNSRGKRISEIDFVATDETTIYFVEVKTRLKINDKFGGARYSLDGYKQRKLVKIVKLFLVKYRQYQYFQPQIDVCLVQPSSLDKTQLSVIIVPHAVSDLY